MSIRIATESDLPRMLEIYRPFVEQTTYSFEYTLPTLEAFTRRFQSHVCQFPWLVWEENGVVQGYAYAGAPWERMAYAWCAEISIYLAPEARGRGVGRRMYAIIEEILRLQGYRVVYALVTTENAGSVAFHEAVGYHTTHTFENCGYKLGRWLGVVWLEKWLNGLGEPQEVPPSWYTVLPKVEKKWG